MRLLPLPPICAMILLAAACGGGADRAPPAPAGPAPGPAGSGTVGPGPPARPPAAPVTPPAAAASERILAAADLLLASCKDREKRLVEASDWTAMRASPHVEVDTGLAAARPPRRWTRMLVPLGGDVRVYIADGETFFSAYIGGSTQLRDALAQEAGR